MSEDSVQASLRALAASTTPGPRLPTADLVWRRAAVRARFRQAERVAKFIRLVEGVAGAVSILTAILVFLTARTQIQETLTSFDPLLLMIAIVGTGIGIAVVLVFTRWLLRED